MFDQICSQEVREEYIANGFLIPDCEIKVHREGYLHITKSKLKHLVYLLDHLSHCAKCTLLDLVPDEFSSDLLLALEKKQEVALENIGMRNTDEENHVEEDGSSGVRIDSYESGSKADNSDQAADCNMQETVNKLQWKTFIAISTVCYHYCLSFSQSDNLYIYTVISGYLTIFVISVTEDIYSYKHCVLLSSLLFIRRTICTYTLLSVGIQPSS